MAPITLCLQPNIHDCKIECVPSEFEVELQEILLSRTNFEAPDCHNKEIDSCGSILCMHDITLHPTQKLQRALVDVMQEAVMLVLFTWVA